MATLGLLGAGWAATVHAMAASVTPDAELVWIGSRTAESAARLAGMGGIKSGLLADLPQLDAVIVATPPTVHRDSVLAALETGASVLVEKPLTATLAQADDVLDAAERSGRVAGTAQNLLFAPAVTAAIAHLAGSGPLTDLRFTWEQPTPTWGHFVDPLVAGGVLFDLGAHPIGLALAVVDAVGGADGAAAPIAVSAELRSSRPDGADDRAHMSIRFDDGTMAVIATSWRGSDPLWWFQAATATRVARVELFPEVVVELDGRPHAPPPVRTDLPDPRLEQLGYLGQLRGFLDAATGRGGRICPVGFGRAVMEVITSGYASAGAGGTEVAPAPDVPRDLMPLQLWHGDRAPS